MFIPLHLYMPLGVKSKVKKYGLGFDQLPPVQVSVTISVPYITQWVLRVINLHEAIILLLVAVQGQKPFIRTH